MSVSDIGPDDEASGLLAKAAWRQFYRISVSELSAPEADGGDAFGKRRVRGEISVENGTARACYSREGRIGVHGRGLWRGQALRLQFAPEDGARYRIGQAHDLSRTVEISIGGRAVELAARARDGLLDKRAAPSRGRMSRRSGSES